MGDEGKGRITDEFSHYFIKKFGRVFHYRDNGGANAGHTVQVGQDKIVLHQLASGIIQESCRVFLSRGMVLHPEDLVTEINLVEDLFGRLPGRLVIDDLAVLSLDTHRAFETAIKSWLGQTGSTSRGISPAYADIIYRYPVRMKDLASPDFKSSLSRHYQFYQRLIQGLGLNMAEIKVSRLKGEDIFLADEKTFISRLAEARKRLLEFIQPAYNLLSQAWHSEIPFVIEKAQALGLDKNWGTYPDVTASDCSFEGVHTSSYGIIDPQNIAVKTAVLKATYTSSVGKRQMPTKMDPALEKKIRQDANEYGATTGRPRDIIYIDLPMLSYLFRVGRVDYLTLTHLDISYPDQPIKVCFDYQIGSNSVSYQPDLDFLAQVKPKYIDLPSWSGRKAAQAKTIAELPQPAQKYMAFLSQALKVKMLMATTGPKRSQSLSWLKSLN